jgi:NADH:ubiquinone oxidoreductase subunit 6 (subunit J)
MAELFFFIAGIGAVAGAIGVVVLRNPLFSVLALVSHLLCLALLFLLLRAEFIAAAQVIIYAGAVMVLYVFVVSYVGGADEVIPLTGGGRAQRLLAVAFGGAIFAELAIAVLGTGLKALSSEGAPYSPGPQAFGTPAYIGRLLLTDFLLPFEVATFLLLIAAVGAVTLARRRRGLESGEPLLARPAIDYSRPGFTGTMAEAVGGRRALTAPDPDEPRAGDERPERVPS